MTTTAQQRIQNFAKFRTLIQRIIDDKPETCSVFLLNIDKAYEVVGVRSIEDFPQIDEIINEHELFVYTLEHLGLKNTWLVDTLPADDGMIQFSRVTTYETSIPSKQTLQLPYVKQSTLLEPEDTFTPFPPQAVWDFSDDEYQDMLNDRNWFDLRRYFECVFKHAAKEGQVYRTAHERFSTLDDETKSLILIA